MLGTAARASLNAICPGRLGGHASNANTEDLFWVN